MTETDPPMFLTTREVADLLRVKERKVYDLAAEGGIPHRRITGKLLFPRDAVMAWMAGDAPRDRPAVLTGSHDPLLDWAVRESGAELATLYNGSAEGLDTFAAGGAALAGLHLPEPAGWNIATVVAQGLSDAVLLGWTVRARGLIVAAGTGDAIRGVTDLKGRRVVQRQPGAGAAALLDRLLAAAGLTPTDLAPQAELARTESDAAAAVASGAADAALGLEGLARQYGLGFVPLVAEHFDLVVDRRSYFTPPVQTFLRFSRSGALAAKAAQMGGYDLTPVGTVRWLSG